MSTTLYQGEDFTVTRFHGGTDRGVCVQIGTRQGFAQLTLADAAQLAAVLLEATDGVGEVLPPMDTEGNRAAWEAWLHDYPEGLSARARNIAHDAWDAGLLHGRATRGVETPRTQHIRSVPGGAAFLRVASGARALPKCKDCPGRASLMCCENKPPHGVTVGDGQTIPPRGTHGG